MAGSDANFLNQVNPVSPFQIADLNSMKSVLDQINGSASNLTKTLVTGFGSATASAKSFNDVLGAVAASVSKAAVKGGSQALAQGLSEGLSSMFSGSLGSSGAVAPFADGGVVASPTYFASNGAIGLMGERGAEAIMPLARGPDGKLGVSTQGAAKPVSITVNIAAQDLESFRRSEAQITGALARAVARGQRNV